MIKVEFSQKLPQGEYLVAVQKDNALKSSDEVVECIVDGKRVLHLKASEKPQLQGALLYKKASSGPEETLILDVGGNCLELLSGIILASWRFDKYRSKKETPNLKRVVVVADEPVNFQKKLAALEGVLYARELTSEPPNCLTPMGYAEKLLELQALGIEVEILDIEAIGMTALLATGQASPHPAAAVVMRWKGSEDAPIALVGKGVTFDSGGLCLKPRAIQQQMKWDKAGAGTVAGVMKALALSNSPAHVIGVVGLVENMPDGKAMKPGDIIKTMSGQTIEIADPDAEGRLVLADCMWYVQKRYSPKLLVDLGTLTAESFASLGTHYAALYTDDLTLSQELIEAGNTSGDLLWRLPMGSYFAKQIESTVADMKNLGEEFWGENGAAAEFLKRFVITPSWAHIDIAGVAWTKEDEPQCPKGPTGFGVRLLLEFLERRYPQ